MTNPLEPLESAVGACLLAVSTTYGALSANPLATAILGLFVSVLGQLLVLLLKPSIDKAGTHLSGRWSRAEAQLPTATPAAPPPPASPQS